MIIRDEIERICTNNNINTNDISNCYFDCLEAQCRKNKLDLDNREVKDRIVDILIDRNNHRRRFSDCVCNQQDYLSLRMLFPWFLKRCLHEDIEP